MYEYGLDKLEWNHNKLGPLTKYKFILFFIYLFKILGLGKNVYNRFSYKDFKWTIKRVTQIHMYIVSCAKQTKSTVITETQSLNQNITSKICVLLVNNKIYLFTF